MLNSPASTFGQFGNDIIAVAEKCNVEVDVVGWFARDVDLRNLFVDIVGTIDKPVSVLRLENERKESLHLRNRGHFHGCADDDYQVDYSGVVLCQSVEEAIGKLFAEESDVGLNRQSVCEHPQGQNITYLHHTRLRNIIATIIFRIRMARSRLRLAVGYALALAWLLFDNAQASLAERYSLLPYVFEYGIAWNFGVAFAATCSGP